MRVLDASALLAYLQAGPGEGTVKATIDGAVISTVNWAEVVQKVSPTAGDAADLRRILLL